HRVPLSTAALDMLANLPRDPDSDFVVPGRKGGKPLCHLALLSLLRRMGYARLITPHGFRSTFRDWAAEQTNHSQDVAEMALAHTISNKVEAAYRRGDMFEKRKALMEDWANCCARRSDKVVSMRR